MTVIKGKRNFSHDFELASKKIEGVSNRYTKHNGSVERQRLVDNGYIKPGKPNPTAFELLNLGYWEAAFNIEKYPLWLRLKEGN